MDIVEVIRSIRTFDLLVALILAAFFIFGIIQGAIRRALGLGSLVFAFLVAAQLREPLGDFLKANWTQYPEPYSVMIGFGVVFVTVSIMSTIAIQSLYKRVTIFEEHPVVDEAVGGILGLIQGLFLIGVMIVILDTFFRLPGYPLFTSEWPFIRELHIALDPSLTAAAFRESLVPIFFAIFGLFIPNDLRAFFPG